MALFVEQTCESESEIHVGNLVFLGINPIIFHDTFEARRSKKERISKLFCYAENNFFPPANFMRDTRSDVKSELTLSRNSVTSLTILIHRSTFHMLSVPESPGCNYLIGKQTIWTIEQKIFLIIESFNISCDSSLLNF